jgi:molybdate transport system substrate-binding protein
MRRSLLLVAAASALGVMVASCQRPQEQSQPPLAKAVEPAQPVKAPSADQPVLMVFAGSATQRATEKLCAQFAERENCMVRDTYGGSGEVLRQFALEQTGDVYIPGSDDFMDKAKQEGHMLPETAKTLCYLMPAIAVERGNPKGIKQVKDLAKPGLKVALADPKAVCLGIVAEEVLRTEGVADAVKKNVVTNTGSCAQTRTVVETGEVDAAIGWDVFAAEAPTKIEIIALPKKLQKFRTVPAAVIKYSKQKELAQKLIDFLAGAEGKAAYKQAGFTVELKP